MQPNNLDLLNAYKTYKNNLTNQIVAAKKQYYEKQVENVENSSQKLWKITNNITNNKKDVETNIEQISLDESTIYTNTKDIVEAFNTHYSEIGQKYAKNITPETVPKDPYFSLKSIFLTSTTSSDIENFINKLKAKKAPGHDQIRAEALKMYQKSYLHTYPI